MTWQTVATTALSDAYGTYGYVYLQYDDSSGGTSRSSRLRFELKSGASVYIYINSLALDGGGVSGQFICSGTMNFWTGSLSAGYHSFTWSCPWYSGTRSYTCAGTIPSGITPPSVPSVSIASKTYNSATFNISISSYGIPASTDGRYIEAAILGQNSYGASYRYSIARNTTSSTITVNNSSTANPSTFNIEGNHKYWYGGYASNTQASNSTVTGTFYTPCPPLSTLSLSSQSYSAYNKVNAVISYTRQSDGGAETRTGYYRYSTDGGSTYSAWTSFGTVSNTSGTFTVALPTSKSVTLQAKLTTPNGGDSTTKSVSFSTKTTHTAPNFTNFEYEDSNSATVALTGNNQTMIQGQSLPLVTISTVNKATENDGVSVSNYAITFIGESKTVEYSSSAAVSTTLSSPSDAGTSNLVVSAVDTLSLSKSVSKPVTIYPWSAPVIAASIERRNNFESESTLAISGTYSPIVIGNSVKNTITIAYRTKKSSSSTWGSWTSRTVVVSGGNWSTSDLSISLDNNYQWDVQVRAVDKFVTSTIDLVLSVGMPNFFIGTDGRVSVGGKPTKSLISGNHGQFEVNGQIYIPNADGSSANAAIRIENGASATDTQVSVKRTDTGNEVWLGVGSGGVNHGVYSMPLNKWLLYGDNSNVYVNGVKISTAALLDRFYPVGSIFITTAHKTSSAVATALGGGTWEKIATNRVLMGSDSDSNLGKTVDSGLPNIKGSMTAMSWDNSVGFYNFASNGAFTHNYNKPSGRVTCENTYWGSGSDSSSLLAFDASQSNNIYGKSSIVQPPAYKVYFWRRTA